MQKSQHTDAEPTTGIASGAPLRLIQSMELLMDFGDFTASPNYKNGSIPLFENGIGIIILDAHTTFKLLQTTFENTNYAGVFEAYPADEKVINYFWNHAFCQKLLKNLVILGWEITSQTGICHYCGLWDFWNKNPMAGLYLPEITVSNPIKESLFSLQGCLTSVVVGIKTN